VKPRCASVQYLIVGLGNPGRERSFSRHNAGWIAASLLCRAAGQPKFRRYRDAAIALVDLGGTRTAVLLPRTWMNVTGPVVARHARRLGVPPERVLVLHDETGNKPGIVTIGGSASGSSHLGVKSIAEALRSTTSGRVKIGIGSPAGRNHDFYTASVAGDDRDGLLASGLRGAIAARLVVEQGGPAAVRTLAKTDADAWHQIAPQARDVVVVSPAWSARARPMGQRLVAAASKLLYRAVTGWRRTVQRRVRLVAVIGTFGKTTTRAAIYQGLGPQLVGTQWPWWAQYNAEQGPALNVLSIWPWRKYGIVEIAGGKPGAMDKHGPIVQPDLVVMTSIGSEHQENWPDLPSKVANKARLLNYLRPGGTFIINADDPYVAGVAAGFRGRVIRYGLGPDAELRAENVALQFPEGTRFTARIGVTTHDLMIPAFGEHAVRSALAALAVAHAEGLPLDPVVARLRQFTPVIGRMCVVRAPNGAWLMRDDYKAPVETFEFALDVLERVTARKKVVIAGDLSVAPGQQSQGYRLIGGRIGKVASDLVVVGRNADQYTRAAVQGGMAPTAITAMPLAYAQAAAFVAEQTGPGDVILVKGRGSDKVQRVSLALLGRKVTCRRYPCRREPTCDQCPMLEEQE
jgi:UDP-N-acetylmuramoyl-tripeptide--D-alanyl-D-alanine ligase